MWFTSSLVFVFLCVCVLVSCGAHAEYFVERICAPCANGTYSFTDPAQVNLTGKILAYKVVCSLLSAVCCLLPMRVDGFIWLFIIVLGLIDHILMCALPADLSSDVCRPCPTGAEHCFKDQIVVKEGHWRINDHAEVSLR